MSVNEFQMLYDQLDISFFKTYSAIMYNDLPFLQTNECCMYVHRGI